MAFFESNDAGEGGAAVGELPVADVEEATLPTGALRDTDHLAHALPLLFFSCKYFNSVCSMLRLSAPSCHHKPVP
eukprot:COSAG06_NODE_9071_length_1995_cov_1.260021_2_plen_75_part_00